MNILFLRGRMDRHKECKWRTLEECTDMWTHLFGGIISPDDYGVLLYSNGNRVTEYNNNFCEIWTPKFDKKFITTTHGFDVIIARGGFKEYVPLLRKYKKAKKVYYGANHGCIPKDGIKYDLILCDSEQQVMKCKKHGLNGKLFIKPAAPQFKPMDLNKKYDVGFSAIWPNDKRKNVAWVHKTAPKGLKILQMGHACKAPSNFSVKLIKNDRMPRAINKCKVIIAPYTCEDSCPRIIPEALACGVPVIDLDTCQFWRSKYCMPSLIRKRNFWTVVKESIDDVRGIENWSVMIRSLYENDLSIPVAAKHLRGLIDEICSI